MVLIWEASRAPRRLVYIYEFTVSFMADLTVIVPREILNIAVARLVQTIVQCMLSIRHV